MYWFVTIWEWMAHLSAAKTRATVFWMKIYLLWPAKSWQECVQNCIKKAKPSEVLTSWRCHSGVWGILLTVLLICSYLAWLLWENWASRGLKIKRQNKKALTWKNVISNITTRWIKHMAQWNQVKLDVHGVIFFTTGTIFEQYDASEILSKIYNWQQVIYRFLCQSVHDIRDDSSNCHSSTSFNIQNWH